MNDLTNRRLFAAMLSFSLALGVSAIAHADDTDVSLASSQFTDKVESSKPVGDADAAARAKVVTYYLEVSNKKAPTDVTLVWRRDGKEVIRQHLDVGTSPRWRTWGMCPTAGAKEMQIDVIDASGHVLKSDTLTLK
jgi:hypothetical protein